MKEKLHAAWMVYSLHGHIYSWVQPSPHFLFHATRRADNNKKKNSSPTALPDASVCSIQRSAVIGWHSARMSPDSRLLFNGTSQWWYKRLWVNYCTEVFYIYCTKVTNVFYCSLVCQSFLPSFFVIWGHFRACVCAGETHSWTHHEPNK